MVRKVNLSKKITINIRVWYGNWSIVCFVYEGTIDLDVLVIVVINYKTVHRAVALSFYIFSPTNVSIYHCIQRNLSE